MKKTLQVICSFLTIMAFSQEKEAFKFKGNIENYGKDTYESLTVIDQREDKRIGTIPFGEKKEMKEVTFPTNPNNDLGSWYKKHNQDGGNSELVMVLKKLKLKTGETAGKNTEGTIDFSVQTFSKDGDEYRFLYKKDTVFTFNQKNVSEFMVKNVSSIFYAFLNKTYKSKPKGNAVTINELADYESYVKNNCQACKNEQLKDGIYLDHASFFNQVPEVGDYVLEKNEKGEVTRAVKEENGKKIKISAHKIFAYVEDGKAYKKVLKGFLDLNKNENGFYVLSNRGYLFSAPSSNSLGMFGLIGGIADAIQQGAEQNKMKKGDKIEIYIDSLTGEYDFPTES